MKAKIGLEIHVTLNTKSKLFCSCQTKSQEPNTNICPVCLGHPGSKPSVNESAVKKIILLAKALNCKVREELVFSRKSYFYPDLSKNYQITQFEEPIGENGFIDDIRIKRIHLEEDPASITRDKDTLIDYNRSGTPLAEIVTEPDITSSSQARDFLKKLHRILKYVDVFNDDDVLKSDVNVSIEKHDFKRVEVKNVTGFKDIETVIDYEILRQQQEIPVSETRGWDPNSRKTISLRKKESEADYAYIYEPDIPTINVLKYHDQKVPELADQKIKKYVELGVDETDADIITMDLEVATFFENTSSDKKVTSQWIRRELLRVLNQQKLSNTKITPNNFSQLIDLVKDKKITEQVAKKILQNLVLEDFDVKEYVKNNNLEVVNDEEFVLSVVDKVLQENSKAIQDYKDGESKALQFLVGQVMRYSKGKANPALANKLILDKI